MTIFKLADQQWHLYGSKVRMACGQSYRPLESKTMNIRDTSDYSVCPVCFNLVAQLQNRRHSELTLT